MRPHIGIERLRQQRMHLLHAAAFDLQHGFDHGMIKRRTFGQAAVQLDMFGARQRRLHRTIEAVDRGSSKTMRGPLRDRRQSHHAAAGLAPVHHIEGCSPRSEIVAGAVNSAISKFGS